MAGTTVRISAATQAALRELARDCNESMQEVLAQAVEAYRRERMLRQSNEAYSRLRADPRAWQDLEEERAAWDSALAGGLDRA